MLLSKIHIHIFAFQVQAELKKRMWKWQTQNYLRYSKRRRTLFTESSTVTQISVLEKSSPKEQPLTESHNSVLTVWNQLFTIHLIPFFSFLKPLNQGSSTLIFEVNCPARFSFRTWSNSPACNFTLILNIFINMFRCVWLGLLLKDRRARFEESCTKTQGTNNWKTFKFMHCVKDIKWVLNNPKIYFFFLNITSL